MRIEGTGKYYLQPAFMEQDNLVQFYREQSNRFLGIGQIGLKKTRSVRKALKREYMTEV